MATSRAAHMVGELKGSTDGHGGVGASGADGCGGLAGGADGRTPGIEGGAHGLGDVLAGDTEGRDGVVAGGAGSRREQQQQEPRQRDGEVFFIAYGRSVGLLTIQAVCME